MQVGVYDEPLLGEKVIAVGGGGGNVGYGEGVYYVDVIGP